MKVRWTNESLRLRITPSELSAIHAGEGVSSAIAFPGGGAWKVQIVAKADETALTFEQGNVRIFLSRRDIEKLNSPSEEGIYFATPGPKVLKYMIEKDFPCAHPRPAQSLEPATETFAPPPSFEDRKQEIRDNTPG